MIHMILHHTTHHTWYMIHIIPHIAKKLIFTGVNKTWSGVSEARKKNSDHCGLEFLSYNDNKFCDLWKSMGKKLILVLHYASVLFLYFLVHICICIFCIFGFEFSGAYLHTCLCTSITLSWRQPRFIVRQTRFHSIYRFIFGVSSTKDINFF